MLKYNPYLLFIQYLQSIPSLLLYLVSTIQLFIHSEYYLFQFGNSENFVLIVVSFYIHWFFNLLLYYFGFRACNFVFYISFFIILIFY